MKFEEFVQYVVHDAHRGYDQLDEHWKPQYDICHPCHINYDFIGHYMRRFATTPNTFYDRLLDAVITQAYDFPPSTRIIETETRTDFSGNSTAMFRRITSSVFCDCTRKTTRLSAIKFLKKLIEN